MTTKIVTDSSADILELQGAVFQSAPLKIITAHKEYVDDASLNVEEMVCDLENYKGRSSTSCPNASDWLSAFGDAEEVFCVTITATLSGSYNAALLAKQMYEEAHPDRRVFVLNSLSTGPEMVLLLQKIQELTAAEYAFDDVCRKMEEYSRRTGLFFMLESMKNLVNNGRVSPLTAKMAGLLGIRVLGRASAKGDLETLNKCRGEERALETAVRRLQEEGVDNGKVLITHCFNSEAAQKLKELLHAACPHAQVSIRPCGGLCSFYAERGGLLIGFERM